MSNDFLTIKQAAKLTGKSEVTIRRLIKRLLKNRTAQTDQMISLTNRHGSSVYKIQQTFLIEHVNLSDEIKEQLLSLPAQSTKQMNTSNDHDQALNSQSPNQSTPMTSGLNSTSADHTASSDHSHTQTPSQKHGQPDHNGNALSNDQETGDSHTEQSPDQPSIHFSESGLALLEKTLDQLSSQLDKKDDQIAEKDGQLLRLDKHLTIERERNKKLTQIVEQGNLLVHSAQQRIPLPADDSTGELVESSIVTEGAVEIPNVDSVRNSGDDKSELPENRGVISRIISRFSRSDS